MGLIQSIYNFFEEHKNFELLTLFKGLLCSFPNLVIYVFIVLLIIGFDQGNVIPIDFFTDDTFRSLSVNIGAFYFQLYFLGIIMSLYPTYIYSMIFDQDDQDEAIKQKWKSDFWGLVYYGQSYKEYKDEKEIKSAGISKEESINPYPNDELSNWELRFVESAVRKFLGYFLFILWGGLVIYTFQLHQVDPIKKGIATGVGVFLTSLSFYIYWYIVVKMKRLIKDQNRYKWYKKKANQFYNVRVYLFLTLFVLLVLCAGIVEWSLATVIIQFIVCICIAVYLLLYRSFRKLIDKQRHIIPFLASIRRMGFVVLGFLLLVNIFPNFAAMINPVNIFLGGLIAFYTILIFIIKTYLFLRSQGPEYVMFGIFKRSYVYVGAAILYSFLAFFLYTGNNLHELQFTEKGNSVPIETFYNSFLNDLDTTQNGPILYAAYGGGLKAHYWNYLLLDKIEEDGCLNNILAMSGVSGGGMGISNFTAMKYYGMGVETRDNLMSEVRGANILSLELAWLFGWDYVREMFPSFLIGGQDRSHRSMNFYQQKLHDYTKMEDDLVNEVSFDSVFNKLFNDGLYFPNVIINSTATTNKSGVVSAIREPGMYPGTINLLDFDQDTASLTFFEAASTCNRFPFISPAANVVSKGHFVDGGYYENSGVMSLLSFKSAMQKYEDNQKAKGRIDKEKTIFYDTIQLVSVRNDKENYIQSLLEKVIEKRHDIPLHLKCNKDHTEISAVVTSITNLERTPTYLRELLAAYHKDKFNVCYIDLPYYIKPKDVNSFFGGLPNDALRDSLQVFIDESNTEIKRILGDEDSSKYKLNQWGVVNPPTARILSRPVELYMEAMLDHKYIVQQLGNIFI